MNILGIDVGGSGIKGGIVNTVNGELISERIRIQTLNQLIQSLYQIQLN